MKKVRELTAKQYAAEKKIGKSRCFDPHGTAIIKYIKAGADDPFQNVNWRMNDGEIPLERTLPEPWSDNRKKGKEDH
ncbi:MAG: hypothetical protein AABY07_00305 [Nanoarchaeota archaeon]